MTIYDALVLKLINKNLNRLEERDQFSSDHKIDIKINAIILDNFGISVVCSTKYSSLR